MVNKADQEVDQVHSKFKKTVNMTFTEVKIWEKNPASKLASLSRKPLIRVMRLLSKPKYKWTLKDVDDANDVISFISRMKKVKRGQKVSGKLSKRDIALRNWGFDPFKVSKMRVRSKSSPQTKNKKTFYSK